MTSYRIEVTEAQFDYVCPRCGYEIHEGDTVMWYQPPMSAGMWVMCARCARNLLGLMEGPAAKSPGEAEGNSPI